MSGEERVLKLIERLERLQAHLDDLNSALQRHLDRMRRRRNGRNATLGSFNRQARKLVDRVPS